MRSIIPGDSEKWQVKNMCNFLNKYICCGLLMGLLAMPGAGVAEVYKWVDEEGRTHYGASPGNTQATTVTITGAPEVDTTVQERRHEQEKMLEVYAEERHLKKEQQLKSEAQQKQRDRFCAELKNDLQDYRQGRGIYYELDENGERNYLSDEEMAQRISQLQGRYEQECS